MRKNKFTRTPVMLAVASLLASLVVFVSSGTASATSDYDNLIHTSPSLYVYTDGAAKSQKMDISASWLEDLGQTYTMRSTQGSSPNFMSELRDIKASGGSLGVVMHKSTDGINVEIFGTRDPDAYCEFTGDVASGGFGCMAHPGFGYISAEYFTHNSYGGNGCGWWWGPYTCSDNGMNIYMSPTVQSGTPNTAYQVKWISNTEISNYMFYYIDFDITYPTGYDGVRIPTQQPNATYVAMGDSFSAGEGNPPFESGTDVGGTNENRCHRSSKAYPRLLEFDSSLNLGSTAFVACSGATTNTVLNGGSAEGSWGEGPQTAALTNDTQVVTITIGGNDVGFADYAFMCTTALCGPGSFDYTQIMGAINDPDFFDHLVQTYETILADAPNAQVYVSGYPFLATQDSDTCGQMDLTGAWAVQDQLNAVTWDAVKEVQGTNPATRLHYIDPNKTGSPFIGKHLCNGGPSDFNGIDTSHQEYSLHPNAGGQEDYASVFKEAIS
ncbi:MAG TPA: SGNH/GDSL hydrolase family protein [Candidatus Saccharimonadales bacterium]|nr:SGNH/GDSL hydrolase family protein [Candidatus Saccharimonadales bacterium]